MLCPTPLRSSPAAAEPSIRRRLRVAHLVYSEDSIPGLKRQRCGRGFTYRLPDGGCLPQGEHRRWIESLAIPPAWTRVWVCPLQNGHLQATGYDDRGRKQYRYHPDWMAYANADKFSELPAFGERLPRIRGRIRRDLQGSELDRQRVLAAVIRLIDRAAVRVGNARYTKENHSYGATTLCGRHLLLAGARVQLTYRGKSGCSRTVELTDKRLAGVLAGIKSLPGQRLFQWLDAEQNVHAVDAADVNEYLREISGADVTAKDFRTWHGSVAALSAILDEDAPETPKKRQRYAVRAAAGYLGNTQATARQYYIHPHVLELATTPKRIEQLRNPPVAHRELKQNEIRLLDLLSR
ncbi:DNA topoisomerase IB [Candidatus Laterigemmans baculatus]|uniref:DNA topoisomerase IB n=1 Tax=Candidatus Laterigemmans baculatus TaxID=2770505 RepID=UPI0013DA5735|nr:DNA topoisomerase IB [Candidatus Laterigemmans baculatus]